MTSVAVGEDLEMSIVICSAVAERLEKVTQNIRSTIGIVHEIISVDNRDGSMGICKAYNLGAARASAPYLCFVHEDVEFVTMGWGRRLVDHFMHTGAGLLGVAGGDAKGIPPGSWSVSMISNEINILQFDPRTGSEEHVRVTGSMTDLTHVQVSVLDGVLLCTRKEIFEGIRFDEGNLQGFHGYDIDYSLSVGERYPVFVINDVLIRHFSHGNPDVRWMEAAVRVSRKWRYALPRTVQQVHTAQKVAHHWKGMQVFMQHLIRLGYTRWKILAYLFEFSCNRYFRPRRFLSLCRYLVNQRAVTHRT